MQYSVSPQNRYVEYSDIQPQMPPQKFNAKDYIIPGTTEKNIIVWKEIFDLLDSNGNGAIQPIDLRKAWNKITSTPVDKKQLYKMLSDFDTDESGIIEFQEFVKIMTMKPCESDTKKDIRKVFERYSDGKDYLDIEDLKLLADESGDDISEEELQKIINHIDKDGNQKISWEQFYALNMSDIF